jgi:hypothetical protein
MRLINFFLVIKFFIVFQLFADTGFSSDLRSFDDIFPKLQSQVKQEAFSNDGFIKSWLKIPQSALNGTASKLDPKILEYVLKKQPKVFVEALTVIPCKPDNNSLLKVYNVLGKVSTLKGRKYNSFSRNESVVLFEEVTRIESAKNNNIVKDPSDALKIPASETIYYRLKDVNFGNTYYRAEMFQDKLGIRYSLTNFKSFTYYLIPVISEEKFAVQLFFEPIKEGILIYGLAGTEVSDFVASQVDMPSAISKRISIIISWAKDGIKAKI